MKNFCRWLLKTFCDKLELLRSSGKLFHKTREAYCTENDKIRFDMGGVITQKIEFGN